MLAIAVLLIASGVAAEHGYAVPTPVYTPDHGYAVPTPVYTPEHSYVVPTPVSECTNGDYICSDSAHYGQCVHGVYQTRPCAVGTICLLPLYATSSGSPCVSDPNFVYPVYTPVYTPVVTPVYTPAPVVHYTDIATEPIHAYTPIATPVATPTPVYHAPVVVVTDVYATPAYTIVATPVYAVTPTPVATPTYVKPVATPVGTPSYVRPVGTPVGTPSYQRVGTATYQNPVATYLLQHKNCIKC
ncbi:hypothetical protein HK101_000831 [Irineochytrium annulatum]|nr:hypothetical protein HK101_000831 [Irineochytrium annulatum]